MLVGESAGRQKHSVYLYRFLGMIGTSLTAHLGSNPAVKKAMPNSLAIVLICKAMHNSNNKNNNIAFQYVQDKSCLSKAVCLAHLYKVHQFVMHAESLAIC